ncbi:unnamed protein product [Rangifer tarandus platyrhynchus]|uniref:Uncharacterized protein n=1 Tax=Rangifer tarandus platyrhynchus TaxID=3082113 RepID=A0AC59Z686_RANTA
MALLGAGPNSVVVSAQAPMPFDLSKGRVCAWILPRSCLLHLEPPAEAGKTAEVRSLQACRGSMTGAGFAPASLAWTSCVPPATPSWRASEVPGGGHPNNIPWKLKALRAGNVPDTPELPSVTASPGPGLPPMGRDTHIPSSAVLPLRPLTPHVDGAARPRSSDRHPLPEGLALAEVTGTRAPIPALPYPPPHPGINSLHRIFP